MAKTIRVQKVGVGSMGKLVGTVNGAVGLAIGILSAIIVTANYLVYTNDSFFVELFTSIGIVLASVILYPLLAYILGWLYGALIGIVFNLVVGLSGGLELTTEEIK